MHIKLERAVQGASLKLPYKGNKNGSENANAIPIYKDIANPDAVRQEIGDVIRVFNQEIKIAREAVFARRDENPTKYALRGFFAQDLNATIKERLLRRLETDHAFRRSVRVSSNAGSLYFIIRDRYILYVKQLYGGQNKPNSYPTPRSERLFNNTLALNGIVHCPVLFIGPNLGNIRENDAFVTSLVSRYEINWTLECPNLFSSNNVVSLKAPEKQDIEKDIVRIKPGREVKKKGTNNQ